MMFAVVLLLALCGIMESCNETAQVCYKCKGDTSVCPDGNGFLATPETCIAYVLFSTTAVAAHYFDGECTLYTCTNNLYFTDSSSFAVRQTCNTDCLNFTLTEHANSKVVAEALISNDKSSIGQCFEDCFETVGCYTFSYDGSFCYIYTSCGTSCMMTSSDFSTVYTRSCHGGIPAVDCGMLASPPNGAVHMPTNTTYNNQARYRCFTGYILVGSNVTTCQSNGQWSGSEPVCIAIDCGTLASPINGVVDMSSGTTYSNHAMYACVTGYTIIGNSSRICQSNGHWSGNEPTCDIVVCGSLSAPQNGHVQTPAITTYLEQAIFSCSVGFVLIGGYQSMCQSNGLWSGTPPICNPVDCGTPTPPSNGTMVSTSGTTYGQRAIFSCNDGYTSNGFNVSECNASGLWDSSPSCYLIDCGFLKAPEHGVVQYPTGTTYGGTATFQCNKGYYLSYTNNRTCVSSGLWSMSTPLCFQNGIPKPVRIYLAPCFCFSNRTFTGLTQMGIIDYLIKELTIERNSTGLARRTRECAADRRLSSQIVGYTGGLVMAGALGIIFLFDLLTFCGIKGKVAKPKG